MSIEAVHRGALLLLAVVATGASLRRRRGGEVAAYLWTLIGCEAARYALPEGTGSRAVISAAHLLYLWPRTGAILGLLGVATRQTWPMVAGAALGVGSVAALAGLYPLGPEWLSVAWTIIEGLAVAVGGGALLRYYLGPGDAPATQASLIASVFVAGDAVRWATAMLAHRARLAAGWPTVRVIGILVAIACLLIFALWSRLSLPPRSPSRS